MAAAAVDLGTIYATIALSMDTFSAQVVEAQGLLDGLMASAESVSAPFAALDEASAAAGEALASVAETSASASDALSALDGAAASGDAALTALGASADEAGAALDAASAQVDANSAALDTNTTAADANAAGHKKAGEASAGLGDSMGKLVMPATIAAAAVAGLAALSVHMAGDFQESMTQLVTGAGESEANLRLVSDGILNLSTATGESTSQLAQGMYMIESAGYHGKAALDALRAAAQGAKVGNADLGTVADATTTILNDYGKSGVTAANAVNALVVTTASGKTHMQDLAGALAQVLPTSAAAGVGLSDVMGAMATMTSEGVPAANAATYLRQTILALEAPSAGTVKALAAVGLKSSDVAAEMQKSLPDALKMITDAVGKKFPEGSAGYIAAMKAISGGSKQMQGVLDLTGDHLATFQTNVTNIGGTVQKAGANIQGWAEVQKDFNQQLAQAGATAQVALIQVGTALEPIVKQVIANVMPALKQFGDWARTHGPEVARDFEIAAAVIGVVLVGALAGAAVAFLAAQAVAIAIVGALGLVAGAVALVVTHWQQIISFITSGNPVMVALEAAVAGVGAAFLVFGLSQIPALIAAIPGVLVSLGTMAAGWWADATAAGAAAIATLAAAAPFIAVGAAVALLVVGIIELVQHWSQVKTFLGNIASAVGGFFSGLGARVHTALAGILTTIGGWFASVGAFLLAWGEKILGWYLWPYEQVWNVLSPILNGIWQTISAVFGFIVDVIRVADDIIMKLVQDAWNWLYGTVIGPILNLIKNIIVTDWAFITSVTQAVWGAISAFFTAIWNAIWTTITTVLDAIKQWLSDRWNEMHAQITAVWTMIHDDVSSIWDKITSTIQNKATALRDAILKPFNDAKTLIGGIVKDLANAAIKELNNVIQGWADLGNDLGSVINTVAKAVGVSDRVPTLTLPTIPLLARGTTHHAGGLAIVGEEGPELVNLPKGTSVLPAGPTAGLLSGWGVPGYAGGVGDFFSALGSKVSGAIGDLSAMLQEGPAGIVQKALSALGFNAASEPGLFSDLAGGALSTLRAMVQQHIGDLLGKIASTSSGAVSASYGSAPGLLPGFPLMNQLAQRDVNDLNDCVPTSMASAASFLLKRLVSPVGLKDDVYGAGYIGGQSPDRYRKEMAKMGLAIQDAYGSAQSLVADIIAHLRAGQPVLGSIPSDWNVISQGGPTHEVAFAGYDAGKGLLTAMNPWKGFFQTASPAWWAPRLQYGTVNPLVKLANGGVLREAVAGLGLSSGRSYLMGEGGPGTEAVVPISQLGGGDTYHISVEVVASPSDGEPYAAGVAFGNGFAAGFQQARTQRGL